MKLQHLFIGAAIAIAAAGCTGGEGEAANLPEQSLTTAAPVITSTTTVVEAPTTTRPPAPTTQAPASSANEVPSSLAFASNSDVGRLFEVDGDSGLYTTPVTGERSTIGDGELVRAAIAQGISGELWVGIVPPEDSSIVLGWILAEDLRPTTQSVTLSDPLRPNELRFAAVRSAGVLDVLDTPGGRTVTTLVANEIAIHGGSTTLTADGSAWLDIIDSSGGLIGWVPDAQLIAVTSNYAQSLADSSDVARRPSDATAYGASLGTPTVSLQGCNAVQMSITNSSSSRGMAFVFGRGVATAQLRGSTETWSAPSGARLFVEPGETVLITVPNNTFATWFFSELDGQLRAQTTRGVDGSPIAGPDGAITAEGFQELSIDAGACSPEPVGNSLEFYEFNEDGTFIEPPVVEDDAELEDAGLDQELLDELEQELNEELNGSPDDQVTEEQQDPALANEQ